ncbi:fungal specific transcription factor domain-containing protein [Sarocladium implicatum]|nr:fungal specific transcription factor domain-containing protein [Sarocladium implicatum]
MDLPIPQEQDPEPEPSSPRQAQWQIRNRRRVAERERKRAARACDSCRRQKEKCDGGVPCRRCVRLCKQCVFQQAGARSAAPQQEPAVRSQVPNTGVEANERIQHMEKLLRHYAGNISLETENLRNLAEAIDKDHPAAQNEGSRYHDSDIGAEEEKFTVQPLGDNITHYSGEFSLWNFSMRIKQWIEQCASDSPEGLEFREYYRAEELQSTSDAFTSLSLLPPRFVADFLVHAFFAHAETNYFYLDKAWLMSKLDVAYTDANSLTRRDVGTVCIIFIILAIGIQYAYLDSPSKGVPGQDPARGYSEDAISISFYQQACRLIPDVITVSSLESVQACLLIGIFALPLDASGLAYTYLNLGVKLAIQNGMHRRFPGEGLDPIIRETRNRVWWSVYTTEKRVGILHGRPISIDIHDIDAEMPCDRSDLWPASSATQIPSMLATLELHKILGRISQEVRSVLKSHTKHSALDPLNRLLDLRSELHRWRDALPDSIIQKSLTPSPTITRAGMHLRLEYSVVRMFAGRALIFLRLPTRSNPSASSSPADATQSSPTTRSSKDNNSSNNNINPSGWTQASRNSESRNILVSDCVEAALDVINTCKTLRDTVGLARASYTEFSACRAAVLVITTQCLQERTARLRQALRDGVSMIKLMSTSGESARSEASLIEVFERAIARLDAADGAASASASAMNNAETEYDRFKKWEMLWKNESSSPSGASTSRQERNPNAGSNPMPPQTTGFWGLDSAPATTASTMPMQGGGSGNSAMNPAVAAMDWGFGSLPGMVDEFSAMLGYGFGPSPNSVGSQGPAPAQHNTWMGS